MRSPSFGVIKIAPNTIGLNQSRRNIVRSFMRYPSDARQFMHSFFSLEYADHGHWEDKLILPIVNIARMMIWSVHWFWWCGLLFLMTLNLSSLPPLQGMSSGAGKIGKPWGECCDPFLPLHRWIREDLVSHSHSAIQRHDEFCLRTSRCHLPWSAIGIVRFYSGRWDLQRWR